MAIEMVDSELEVQQLVAQEGRRLGFWLRQQSIGREHSIGCQSCLCRRLAEFRGFFGRWNLEFGTKRSVTSAFLEL